MADIEEQIKQEIQELEALTRVSLKAFQSHSPGRCYCCGRFADDLVYVETFHGVDRYKGVSCCGGRHL